MIWWPVGGAAIVIGVLGVRDARATRRRRVCPVCDCRALTTPRQLRWRGPTGGGFRTEYRCDGLFSEIGSPVMTAATHAEWLATPPKARNGLPSVRVHRPEG